ncbi:MAG TPA: ECF transporter S component [Candidatus Fournierella excrementigallinarum]|nr:ECF transporter S component [Candidatus Fournierella excrementigallinarum]
MSKKIERLTLFLIPIGVAVNLVGFQLFAIMLKLPLSMDSIGTIVVGTLCGPWAGAIVGFLSNLVNCITDPTAIFFAPLNIVFGVIAGFMGKKGAFDSFAKALVTSPFYSVIGGLGGALTTYLAFGLDFDAGWLSVVLGIPLYEAGMPKLLAIAVVRLISDVPDKIIACMFSFLIIMALPVRYLVKLPNGERFIKKRKSEQANSGAA